MSAPMTLPVIDMAPLFGDDADAKQKVASDIGRACEDVGFFYVSGHGLSPELFARLEAAAHQFFSLPASAKARVSMEHAGAAWRGWFPFQGELTSGAPDEKEGYYFGEEMGETDPHVIAGTLLHGANLWPEEPVDLRPAVEAWFAAVSNVAEVLTQGVSLALGLPEHELKRRYLAHPTRLFRIFHYPPTAPAAWGVGEHTDYGLLTLLAQDEVGGLGVKTHQGWVEAPVIDGTLVCNIGDMLERLTGGRFVSTPHRVVNRSGRSRLSFPFFYDPDFEAVMEPIFTDLAEGAGQQRWDGADVHAYAGTYGDYLKAKVGRVFPGLASASSGALPSPAG